MATGRIGVVTPTRLRWSKVLGSGLTSISGIDDSSITLSYDAGFEEVFMNGVLLSRGTDYTATNGNTVTLTTATVLNDIVEIFANSTIQIVDTFTQAVANNKFINNTIVDAKGDLLTATANNIPDRIAAGADGQVLTADSTQSTGLAYKTPSVSDFAAFLLLGV